VTRLPEGALIIGPGYKKFAISLIRDETGSLDQTLEKSWGLLEKESTATYNQLDSQHSNYTRQPFCRGLISDNETAAASWINA
jgi:hypothetical protein